MNQSISDKLKCQSLEREHPSGLTAQNAKLPQNWGLTLLGLERTLKELGTIGWGRDHDFPCVGDGCTLCQVFVRNVLKEQNPTANSKCFVKTNKHWAQGCNLTRLICGNMQASHLRRTINWNGTQWLNIFEWSHLDAKIPTVTTSRPLILIPHMLDFL